jgi:hypothetical protein
MNTLEVNKNVLQAFYFTILLTVILKNSKQFIPEIKNNPLEKPIKAISKHINNFGSCVSNNLSFQFKKINKYIIIFIISLVLSIIVFYITYKFVQNIRNIHNQNSIKNIEIKIKKRQNSPNMEIFNKINNKKQNKDDKINNKNGDTCSVEHNTFGDNDNNDNGNNDNNGNSENGNDNGNNDNNCNSDNDNSDSDNSNSDNSNSDNDNNDNRCNDNSDFIPKLF